MKPIEPFGHRVGRCSVILRNEMSRNVHAELHGASQVDRDDVLPILIAFQVLNGVSPFVLYPLHTPPQGLDLFQN